MKNTCIKILSEEHGKLVIDYYKSNGINTKHFAGTYIGGYYGVFDNRFDCRTNTGNCSIIDLPNNN